MLTWALPPWGRGCVLTTRSSGADSVRGRGCHAQLCLVFVGRDAGELAQVPGEEEAPVDLEVGSLEREQLGEMEGSHPCIPADIWAVFRGLCTSPIGSLHTRGGDWGGGQDSPALKMGTFRDTTGRDISPMTRGVCSSSESVYSTYCIYTAHSTLGPFTIIYCIYGFP